MCWIFFFCWYFLIIWQFTNQNVFYLLHQTYEEAFNDITAASVSPAEWWRSLRVTPVTRQRPKHRAARCWCGVSVGVRPWLTLTSHTSPALTTSSPASPHRPSPGISCLWVRAFPKSAFSLDAKATKALVNVCFSAQSWSPTNSSLNSLGPNQPALKRASITAF